MQSEFGRESSPPCEKERRLGVEVTLELSGDEWSKVWIDNYRKTACWV